MLEVLTTLALYKGDCFAMKTRNLEDNYMADVYDVTKCFCVIIIESLKVVKRTSGKNTERPQ